MLDDGREKPAVASRVRSPRYEQRGESKARAHSFFWHEVPCMSSYRNARGIILWKE